MSEDLSAAIAELREKTANAIGLTRVVGLKPRTAKVLLAHLESTS